MSSSKLSVLVWVLGGMVQEVNIATPDGKQYDWGDKEAPVNVVIADMDLYDVASTDYNSMKGASSYLRREAAQLPEPLRTRLLQEIAEAEEKFKT